jgi:hypothetical protein
MNKEVIYDVKWHLDDNFDDLNGLPSQLAAAELVLDILRQPAWMSLEKDRRRADLHTQLDSWYKTGPFSSQKWSTATTVIAWQPLDEISKIFYAEMESYIRSCIWRIENQDMSVNNHITNDPECPVGHMPIFCDLVRLIMGTVDGTPLSREYRALTTVNAGILYRLNPVKTALQRDVVWVQLLKDMVAYVRCAEGEEVFELVCNLTKMAASVEESRLALDTEYKRLLANRTELQVHAGVTIAQHRHPGNTTHVLMHKLLHLTQV